MDGASRVRIHSITGYLRDQLQVDPIRMLLQWNEWRGLLDFTCFWGSAVLAYLYRALCRASIGNVVDICGFIPLFQVWCWKRILPVQPSAPPQHDGDMLLSYARRWTRGIDRDTESHHVLISIRDQLDRMTEDQLHKINFIIYDC
uniref:Aminotransferase-like plant mobile domain-containing protein n=1 Tax=Solanum lycopersicum TaxID=4081 RepID=A0A3Q7EX52_SOLLC